MKKRIQSLNSQFVDGNITLGEYNNQCFIALQGMDWQKKIQYQNMMLS